MAGDVHYGNVSLLLHCDGTNNSTVFTDSSLTPKTVTAIGNAKISTTQSKFGGASAYFDGSGDVLTLPDNTAFPSGTDNWTIETQVYPTANLGGTYYTIISNCFPIQIYYLNGTVCVYLSSSANGGGYFVSGMLGPNNSVAVNAWSHIALVNNNGVYTIYVNGVAGSNPVVSATALAIAATAECIGALRDSASSPFSGYIDELRITKGIARYTANFTPPASAFADYGSEVTGTLSESLAASTFLAQAHDVTSGVLVGTNTFTGASFTINLSVNSKACNVTVRVPYKIWTASTVYALNDLVFPTNPITTPYYYKRIAIGTSGATEPTWPTTPGSQCNDGAVTNAWELVERLVQPITHGPLIPS